MTKTRRKPFMGTESGKYISLPVIASMIIWLATISSCTMPPMTKEAYMEKYEAFINNVERNHKSFSDKDWKKKDELYEKFNGKWYSKFKDDFTVADGIRIYSYKAKYNLYQKKQQAASVINALFDAFNADDLKKQLKNYVDNDMKDDLVKVYNEAQKAGNEVAKAVNDILEELNININDLKNK